MLKSSAFGLETAAFRREFAESTDASMRRRIIWFIIIWGGLSLLAFPIDFAARIGLIERMGPFHDSFARAADWSIPQGLTYFASYALWFVVYAFTLVRMLTGGIARRSALTMSLALVASDGIIPIAFRASGLDGFSGVWMFAVSHFAASLVFLWSPRQALIPAAFALGLNLLSRLTIEDSMGLFYRPDVNTPQRALEALALLAGPLLILPGTLICWLRHSRRLERSSYAFLQRRYGSLRQELSYARMVHESLFPAPIDHGPVRFSYAYEPMRQIGGDFLHAHAEPCAMGGPDCLSLVILDVTGHGIPAALTVNRLHGEIELLFAGDPSIAPGAVLTRLNRYVHLTLARHSMFATALCLRVRPDAGTIEYASAGHPPAFLLAADGTLDELRSTSVLLGAIPEGLFDPGQLTMTLGPGDALLAYTDGITESRDEAGRMLRVDGLRQFLRSALNTPQGQRPDILLRWIANYRGNLPPQDDALVVELYRPLAATPSTTTTTHAPSTRPGSDHPGQSSPGTRPAVM